MNDLIEVIDLSEATGKSITAKNSFDQVVRLTGEITDLLASDTWQGEAHKKCKVVHEAVVLYMNEIEALCGDLKSNLERLDVETNQFSAESDKVRSLNNI